MDLITDLALVNGLLGLVERLLPKLKGGTITVEEQEALMAKIDGIRSGLAFSGPEWKPEPETGTPPPAVG